MLIHSPPSGNEEFVAVVSQLTKGEFALFEKRLLSGYPEVRIGKARSEGGYPTLPRFTLLIHRDDRERAGPLLDEAIRTVEPSSSWIERTEKELAGFVRQYVRASQAEDASGVDVMCGGLCRALELMLGWLMDAARWEVIDITLDGITPQDIQIRADFRLVVLGYVWGLQGLYKEPFSAELQAAGDGPTLHRFVVRLGDLQSVFCGGGIKTTGPASCRTPDHPFEIRVGSADAKGLTQPVNWALTFAKTNVKQEAEGLA